MWIGLYLAAAVSCRVAHPSPKCSPPSSPLCDRAGISPLTMPNRRTKLAIRRGGVSDDQRLKKWSPRSRNGCTTCRLRRVKCDEAKPICAQCVMAQRHCAGSFYQDAARSPPINQSVTDTSVSKAMKAPRSVKVTNFRGWELAPGGWEMIEAFEYCTCHAAEPWH